MKKIFLFSLWLLVTISLSATTTLRLHSPVSAVSGYQGMTQSLGPIDGNLVTSITNTTASGTSIQFTATSGGSVIAWISEPIASGVTLSGTETCNLWAKEAAAANNASFTCTLYKWTVGGGQGSSFCAATWGTELTTTSAAHAPTCTATSTTFAATDRIVMIGTVINCTTSGCPTGTMGAGTPGVTVQYDSGTASVAGDSNVQFAETISFNPEGGAGGTPTLIQVADDIDFAPDYLGGTSVANGTTISTNFPNPVGGGNLVSMTIDIDDTTSYPTFTDDKSDVCYVGSICKDTTNGEDILTYICPNATSGAQKFTTTFHAASDFGSSPGMAEWKNVATANPIDGGSCGFANSTTVAAGAVVPNFTGDLVIQAAWNEWSANISTGGGAGVHYTAGSQANITWQMFINASIWETGAQYGIYSSPSSLNPTMAISTAGFVSNSLFLKSSTAGTSPAAGMRIIARKQAPINDGGTWVPTNPDVVWFPCPSSANLLIADYAGPSYDMTAVSDSHSNSWASSTAGHYCDGGGDTCLHTYHANNSTTSTDMSVTLTFNTQSEDSIYLYCVAGAATSAYDTTQTNTGNQSSAGNLTVISGFTPSTSNGLVTIVGSQQLNTTSSWASGQMYDGCFQSNEGLDIGGCAANNMWGHYYNPNTTAETWTAAFQSGTEAATTWVAETDSYKAASGGTTVVPRGTLIGVGP